MHRAFHSFAYSINEKIIRLAVNDLTGLIWLPDPFPSFSLQILGTRGALYSNYRANFSHQKK
jgi:hypothetical protein